MMGFALAARGLLCSAVLVAAATVGQAQTYPSKPIRIILPYVPGGIIDTAGRNLALRLSESLGQSVVAENRPGAGGMVGADVAARATPDGYTILLSDPALASNPTLHTDVPYDLFKGLQTVSIVGSSPAVIVASLTLPVKTFAEFIAYAKANPGKLNNGTPGLGSSSHLTGEMLKLASGIEMTHVPYAGLAPALTDLLAGHTDVMVANLDSSLAQVQEGKLKGLAVTGEKRAPEVPDLPAIAETYPEVVSTSWFAVVAPPKTPPEIAGKLSRAFAEILREPEVERKWREMSLTPVGGTPEEVGAFLKDETARWRKVIVSGGIKRP